MPSVSLSALFESLLAQRGIEFEALDDGRYALATEAGEMTVALDNLSRQYARDQDAEAVGRFIDSVLASVAPLPDWQDARDGLFPMIENGATEIGDDTIARRLSDETVLALVHFSEASGTVRLLTAAHAESWGVSLDQLWGAAEAALDRIMQAAEVTYLDADDLRLGVIEVHEPHKASLIRAPSLRQKVEGELGWPIYAVAPSRGFVFLIGGSDRDQLGRVGALVVEEFNSAEYPISTEVWEIGDSGIQAIGAFQSE